VPTFSTREELSVDPQVSYFLRYSPIRKQITNQIETEIREGRIVLKGPKSEIDKVKQEIEKVTYLKVGDFRTEIARYYLHHPLVQQIVGKQVLVYITPEHQKRTQIHDYDSRDYGSDGDILQKREGINFSLEQVKCSFILLKKIYKHISSISKFELYDDYRFQFSLWVSTKKNSNNAKKNCRNFESLPKNCNQ
jgi:hypothetical protein